MFKLCTNKNNSYKHNEQINNQNIDNFECFGVKNFKIYPEMTFFFFLNIVLVDYIGIFLHAQILLATHCNMYSKKLYVIKFVSDLRLVGGYLWVLRFLPPIKLTDDIAKILLKVALKMINPHILSASSFYR